MPSVCHKYHDHKFTWSHQDCVITTMHVLIKFKGTTVTSKIMKQQQQQKSRRYRNTQEKLSLVKIKKATDVTGPDFLYTCLVMESNNLCPTVEAFCGGLSAYREPCTRSFFLLLWKSVCGTEQNLPDSSFNIILQLSKSAGDYTLVDNTWSLLGLHPHTLMVMLTNPSPPFTMYTSLMGTVSPYVL